MKIYASTRSSTLATLAILFTYTIPLTAAPYNNEQFLGIEDNSLREPPKFLKICHKRNKNFNQCVKSSLEKFLDAVNSDTKRSDLPTIDPIKIPVLQIKEGSGNVSLDMTFNGAQIFGFKKFKITHVTANLNDSKFEISMTAPYINIKSEISFEGGILTFPISGKGDFELNMTDVSVVWIIHLKTSNDNDLPDLSYFTVEKSTMDLLPGSISSRFGDAIDGSKELGLAFNTYFNNNAQEFFTLVKSKVTGVLSEVAAAIANEVLERHPYDVLIPV